MCALKKSKCKGLQDGDAVIAGGAGGRIYKIPEGGEGYGVVEREKDDEEEGNGRDEDEEARRKAERMKKLKEQAMKVIEARKRAKGN